eukprot:TRINITY_DN22766_c0_g1_i2.p2 TRINITY_DN22766_c0_g1~~TRINITY_DN22766_c0_g1_i2.p2  ORF type:complete len:221 (+),score=-17.53 TRINITY_DN22766_c0_g1_i2:303-965(+)
MVGDPFQLRLHEEFKGNILSIHADLYQCKQYLLHAGKSKSIQRNGFLQIQQRSRQYFIVFFSSRIRRPENFPLFFDGYRSYSTDPKPFYLGTIDNNETLSYFHVRHGNSGNIGFADGHVSSQRKESWASNINDSIIIPYGLQSYYTAGIWYMEMVKIPRRVNLPQRQIFQINRILPRNDLRNCKNRAYRNEQARSITNCLVSVCGNRAGPCTLRLSLIHI